MRGRTCPVLHPVSPHGHFSLPQPLSPANGPYVRTPQCCCHGIFAARGRPSAASVHRRLTRRALMCGKGRSSDYLSAMVDDTKLGRVQTSRTHEAACGVRWSVSNDPKPAACISQARTAWLTSHHRHSPERENTERKAGGPWDDCVANVAGTYMTL